MSRVIRNIIIILVVVAIIVGIGFGIRALVRKYGQINAVNWSVSSDANNFEITRRLEVINARTDTALVELIGNFAITNNSGGELVVTVKLKDGTYKKHYIYLNDWTIYIVEDLTGSNVEDYHYEFNSLPDGFQDLD